MAHVRPALPGDASLLAEMLRLAVLWRPDAPPRTVEEVMGDPALARYVEGWPQPGDAGVVAEEAGRGVGAAWWRFLPAAAPGYGFVAADIPEISTAVAAAHRGQGVGRRLLEALIDRGRTEALPALSLSVEPDNPARHLYADLGFSEVGGHGAVTMLLPLPR